MTILTTRYAAFGSNLHPTRLRERASSVRLLGTSFLADYGLRFHKRSIDNSGKCNIDSSATGVWFAVYEMSIVDKRVLDEIEGIGRGYVDGTVALPSYGQCVTYVAEPSHVDDTLVPYDWYRELVLLGCLRQGFPGDYLAGVQAVDAIPDPDQDRGAVNWELIERIRNEH